MIDALFPHPPGLGHITRVRAPRAEYSTLVPRSGRETGRREGGGREKAPGSVSSTHVSLQAPRFEGIGQRAALWLWCDTIDAAPRTRQYETVDV